MRIVLTTRTTRGIKRSRSRVDSLGREWFISIFPKRPTPFARRSCEFSVPTVRTMSAGDVAAIAHKGDFPMPQAGGSPSYSFERTYAKVGVLVRISGGCMFATLDLLSNGRAGDAFYNCGANAARAARKQAVRPRIDREPCERVAPANGASRDQLSSDGAENVG